MATKEDVRGVQAFVPGVLTEDEEKAREGLLKYRQMRWEAAVRTGRLPVGGGKRGSRKLRGGDVD